jgi:pimeloyl-ACP methyl ester carboxylesterase
MPHADLGDVSIHYSQRGDGDPPVLGIMGFGLDQRFWAGQIPTVTADHRFITFDNRAVGRTSGPPVHTIDEMAADAARLLDHLGVEKAVIMGVSMGGAIAQRLALDRPDLLAGLALIITFARPIEFMRRQHEVTRVMLRTLGEAEFDAFVDASLIRMFTPDFFEAGRDTIDQLVRSFYADGNEGDPDVLLAQLDALDKHDTLAQLSTISCPTLVVGARQDQMVPYLGSVEIAQAIPQARFETFETGHGCMIEEMDRFNSVLAEFLAEVRAR